LIAGRELEIHPGAAASFHIDEIQQGIILDSIPDASNRPEADLRERGN